MDASTAAILGTVIGGTIGLLTGVATAMYAARANRHQFLLQQRRHDYHECLYRLRRVMRGEYAEAGAFFDALARVDLLADESDLRLVEELSQLAESLLLAKGEDQRAALAKQLGELYPQVKATFRNDVRGSI